MKKIITLLLVISSCGLFAQFGVKISNIRPTGNFGASVKATVGGELVYKPFNGDEEEDESGWHMRVGVGFVKFTARKDTFPTYGVLVSQGTTVTPGYTVIHKYNIATLSLGSDYMFGLSDKAYLYPGLDVGALFSSVEYESYAPLISSEGYSGGSAFLALRFRLGGEYLVNENIGIFAEVTRSMNFSPEVGGLAYNDYGIGIRLNF